MPLPHLAALAVAVAASATDVKSRRIPNVLTFGSALVALIYHCAVGGVGGLLGAGLGWLVGVAFFFLPFALGGMGGGDVKLMGALGAWLGAAATVWVVLYAGVAGGVLALAVAIYKGYLRKALENIWLLLVHWRVAGLRPLGELTLDSGQGPRLAYAVPILVGTVVTTCLHF
jgi:prepilin peptidase CpaA